MKNLEMLLIIILQILHSLNPMPDLNIILHFDDLEQAEDNSTNVENEMDINNNLIGPRGQWMQKCWFYGMEFRECEHGLICLDGLCKRKDDGSCNKVEDCKGTMTDGWIRRNICKNGNCKVASGCGMHISCYGCSKDDCDDNGICNWMYGKCRKIIARRMQKCQIYGPQCQVGLICLHGICRKKDNQKEGDTCGYTTDAFEGKCKAGLECMGGYKYMGANYPGTCRKVEGQTEGGTCGYFEGKCKEGLECVGGWADYPGICRTLEGQKEGETCGDFEGKCKEGLECVGGPADIPDMLGGICRKVEPTKLGGPCVPCDGFCQFKQKCREGLSCVRVRSPGFHVPRATCQPESKERELCNNQWGPKCEEGLTCPSGLAPAYRRCQKAQKIGESCYANWGPKCGDELKCDLKRSMCVSVWETPMGGPQ